mgnify:FL=1
MMYCLPLRRGEGESPTLFIGGLSGRTTKASIADYFRPVGDVIDVRMPTDPKTGKVICRLFSFEDSDSSSFSMWKQRGTPTPRLTTVFWMGDELGSSLKIKEQIQIEHRTGVMCV